MSFEPTPDLMEQLAEVAKIAEQRGYHAAADWICREAKIAHLLTNHLRQDTEEFLAVNPDA
jgi:hypothetical protein